MLWWLAAALQLLPLLPQACFQPCRLLAGLLAIPCMMSWGRWSYKSDASWGADKKETRRKLHGGIMALATMVALAGYLCIFMAHLAKKSFFGYQFDTHSW